MGPRILRESIGSTQTHAVGLARAGSPPGTRVVARRQSDGHGRADHAWVSPPGGLYLSEILAAPTGSPTLFPLAVGAEIAQFFAQRFDVHTLLRWPNDILVVGPRRPRKLAGILCDVVEATWGPALVVGVGVNVRAPSNDFPLPLRSRLVGLADLVTPAPELDDVEAEVGQAIDRAIRGLSTEPGRNRILRLTREALYGIGREAVVDGRPAGIIRGIGADGGLRVADGLTESSIHAGSLAVEEPA